MTQDLLMSAVFVETLFWLAIAAIIIGGMGVTYIAWRILDGLRSPDSDRLDPERATLPQEIYRIVELREFLDSLFLKLYGRPIDDYQLVRIDRALGAAAVAEYKRIVFQAVPNLGFAYSSMFLSLARDAAVAAKLRRPSEEGLLAPRDVLELKPFSEIQPGNRQQQLKAGAAR